MSSNQSRYCLLRFLVFFVLMLIPRWQFKDIPFVVRRFDTDIHVVPMKYLDELRLVPRNDLNGKMVHYNVSGPLSSKINMLPLTYR